MSHSWRVPTGGGEGHARGPGLPDPPESRGFAFPVKPHSVYTPLGCAIPAAPKPKVAVNGHPSTHALTPVFHAPSDTLSRPVIRALKATDISAELAKLRQRWGVNTHDKFIAIRFDSSQFGVVNEATGEFDFEGQN
jgi:hypothetical protein